MMAKALLYITLVLLFSGCRLFRPVADPEIQTIVKDSARLSIVAVEKISGTVPELGDSLIIPTPGGMAFKMIRINQKDVLIQTPIRREISRHTAFVPVKQVDKSRTDNRSYTDSYNRSKQDNDIKTKTKQTEKQSSRHGLPWWAVLLSVIAIGLYLYFKGKIKRFLP